MKISDVCILKEAVDDLNEGKFFYDLQEFGVEQPKKIGETNKTSPIDIYEKIKSIVENQSANQAK